MKSDFSDDKATTEWLDSFESKKNTQNTYATGWRRFLEYAGMTGDQILADRKGDHDFRWERKTLDFKRWMVEGARQLKHPEKKLGEHAGRTAATSVEGFFSFYRMSLKFRRSESAMIREAKRKQEDYRFSKEDFKRMVDVADLTEKYVILVGKSFGLRAGDFLRLTRGDLETYISREPPIFIGEYMTQKEHEPAFPFIDSDAKPVIQNMLKAMDKNGRVASNERILKFKNEIQLSRVLLRAADRAGIKYGNKNVRFHCLRKFLADRLSNWMSSEKWKQIVGKAVPESAYVSPDQLREDYMKAVPETALAETGLEERLKKNEAIARIQGKLLTDKPLTPDDYKGVTRYNIRLGKRREKPKTKDCADSEHCQKIVGEAELPGLLAGGWRVAAVLPSGKVVVANE